MKSFITEDAKFAYGFPRSFFPSHVFLSFLAPRSLKEESAVCVLCG